MALTEELIPDTSQQPDNSNRMESIKRWIHHHRLLILLSIVSIFIILSLGSVLVIKSHHDSQRNVSVNSRKFSDATNAMPNQAKQQANCTAPSDDRFYRTDRSLAIDPRDPKHLFVAIEYKGAYQSFDSGKTWQPTLQNFQWYTGCFPEPFKAMISPIDSKTIYLSANGSGIVKTSDGGKTWKKLYQTWQYGRSEDFEFDPTNAHVIYAATEDIKNAPNPNDNSPVTKGLVYKSSDDGTTWTELPTGLMEGTGNNGIVVSRTNPSHILSFTLTVHFHPGGRQIDTSNQMGILESSDTGNSWTALHTIPAGYDATGFMAYSPLVTDNIYVTSFTAPGTPEVDYSSLDFGNTWKASNTVMSYVFYDSSDATGLHMLGINSQPNVNTANKFFESSDGGRSWQPTINFPAEVINSGDHKTLISDIKWDPANPSIIYASAASGFVWKSTDSGQTWQKILSYDSLPK